MEASRRPVPGADLGNGLNGYLYAEFSPDGRTIAVTDTTGRVWLYPATTAGLARYAADWRAGS